MIHKNDYDGGLKYICLQFFVTDRESVWDGYLKEN